MKPSATMISICLCIAVMLAAGVVYHPLLSAGFADATDNYYLHENGNIWARDWNWEEVGCLFQIDRVHRPDGTGGYYQPMTALSLRLDAWLSRPESWLVRWTTRESDATVSNIWLSRVYQFHLTNLLLHTTNTALVFLIVRKLSKTFAWPALLACVFAFHPTQVESVAWISQRMTLLGGFFSLASLACYVQSQDSRRRLIWVFLATLAYTAAVLSRPLFIALPVVMLALDLWVFRRAGWKPLVEKVPMCAVLLVATAVQWSVRRAAVLPRPGADDGVEPVSHDLASLIARLFWPVELTPYNPVAATAGGATLGPVFDAALICLVFAALAWAMVKAKPIFAALVGSLLLVLPALLEAPFTTMLLSDQYLYGALIVPIIVLAVWLGKMRGELSARQRQWSLIAAACVALIFAVHAHAQTWVWQGSRSLYEQTTRLYPNWIHAHIGLIESLIQENEFDLALAAAQRAEKRNPDHPSVDFYIGTILLLSNDSRAADAVAPLKRALQSNPDWIECLQNIGVALARSGRNDEAIQYLERARDLQPRSAGIRLGLGHAYLKVQRFASARREFQEALRHRNDPMAHLGLAIAWAANDEPHFALRHLEAAVAKDPKYAERAGRSPELRKLRDVPGFSELIRVPREGAGPAGSATESPAATRAHGL